MLDRRLQFVVGKGGVGKSTVTAALALAAAARGLRVLTLELGAPGGVARLFGKVPTVCDSPIELRPGLHLAYVKGEAALAEYLEIVVPIKRLLRSVFESRLYTVFVAAAPGLKELMTIGKIWFEAEKRRADGGFEWDRIIVDAGASGHSLQYLQMPSTAAETFRTGLVHRESLRVQSLLRDREATCVHVVATPEEMPLVEAEQIIAKLREQLELPLGMLVVNRCRPPAPPGMREALDVLTGTPTAETHQGVASGVVDAARNAIGWLAVQESGLALIEQHTGIEPLRLPLLASEEFGLAEVERLASVIETGGGPQ